VLSKIDLDPRSPRSGRRSTRTPACACWRPARSRAHDEATLAELARLLHENNSVVVGLSGAGKSSLLNAWCPASRCAPATSTTSARAATPRRTPN
jgi:putative ribosome biogenesis GTPase RsgA